MLMKPSNLCIMYACETILFRSFLKCTHCFL